MLLLNLDEVQLAVDLSYIYRCEELVIELAQDYVLYKVDHIFFKIDGNGD